MTQPLVLLADDFVDAAEMYAEYLRFHGFEVVTVTDGLAAVEAARALRPDIILLDIRMPGLTGTEALRELKADPLFDNVPIAALTAHARPEERDSALAAGFDMFISKPVLPDRLLQILDEMLARRGRPRT
jgi:two-component system cell cycle response regulator DivK